MSSSNRRCPAQNAIVAALGAAATPYCSSILSLSTQTYTDISEFYVTSMWTDTTFPAATTVTADPISSTAVETTTETTCTYPPRPLMPRGAAKTIIVTATTTICPCTETSSKAPCSESVDHESSGYADSSFAYTAAETSSPKASSLKTSDSESGYQGPSSYADSPTYSYVTATASLPTSTTAPYYSIPHNSSVHPSGSYSHDSLVYSHSTSVYSSGVSSYVPESSIYSSESSTTSETPSPSPTPTPPGSELLTTIDDAGLSSACSCLSLDVPTETVVSTTTLTSTETTVEYAIPTITATPIVVETSTVTSTSTTECCTLQPYYTTNPSPPTGAICGTQYTSFTDTDSFGGAFESDSLEECSNIVLAEGYASFYWGISGDQQHGSCGFFTKSLFDVGPYDNGGWELFFDENCFIRVDPCAASPASTSSPTPTPSMPASSSISVSSSASSTTPAATVCTATPYNTANPTPPEGAYCGLVFAVPDEPPDEPAYEVVTSSASSVESCRDIAIENEYKSFYYITGSCTYYSATGSQLNVEVGDDVVFYDTSCFETINPCQATTPNPVTYSAG